MIITVCMAYSISNSNYSNYIAYASSPSASSAKARIIEQMALVSTHNKIISIVLGLRTCKRSNTYGAEAITSSVNSF